VSRDGSVIAGTGTLTGGKAGAFRWTKAGGAVSLGDFAAQTVNVVGMSADGSVIVGNAGTGTLTGFVWSAAAKPQLGQLTALGGDDHTNVMAVSADGSLIVGDSLQAAAKIRRVRWTTKTTPVLLDPQDTGAVGAATSWACGGGPYTTCTSIAQDGSVIYTQRSVAPNDVRAEIWTAAKGLQPLGPLTSPQKFNCTLIGPQLPVLSGLAGNCIGPPIATVWDEKLAAGSVASALATYGISATELTNATITEVRAVSADSTTILGDTFSNGNVVWIARLGKYEG
jgi:uncharacterized membrane protein